jgi:hypothetical protein
MADKKERAIVIAMTAILLCAYFVVPVIGAENAPKLNIIKGDLNQVIGVSKVKIVDGEDAKKVTTLEESKNLSKVYDDGSKSKYTNDNNTYIVDEEEPEKEDESSILDSLNPLNVGKKMVGEGGIYFLELLGDAGFNVGMNGSTNEATNIKKNYGQAVALIYAMTTIEFDPSQNDFIKELQIRFGLIGFFLMLMFILLGGAYVNIYMVTSARNAEKAYILSNRYHIPINEYALTIVESCLMMTGGYMVLRVTILMELLFTKLIMLQILDRIAPTDSNLIMYLMMSLCYLLIGIAIAYRILIIGLFHATYIVFIGLYCFGITRPVSVAAFLYYLKMLFLRPILVGVTVIGVGIISTLGLPAGSNPTGAASLISNFIIQPVMYSALVLILLIICVMFILGVTTVVSATKLAVRRYTYGAYRP